MRSFIKFVSIIFTVFSAIVFSLIYVGDRIIPDDVTTVENTGYEAPKIFGVAVFKSSTVSEAGAALGTAQASQNETQIKLLNIVPVKKSKITNSKRQYVIPGGDVFGIKLYTDGVIIVGADSIETDDGKKNPAEDAGLKIGDIIKSVNGNSVSRTSEISQYIRENNDGNISMKVQRGNETLNISFTCVKEKDTGKYRAGLWVRDSTAGLGTVTFYNPDNNSFGGLGHAICDVDTEEIMPIAHGEMAEAYVNGMYKSSSGNVGELCGVFTGEKCGDLCVNNDTGVYGYTDKFDCGQNKIPVAIRQEVHTGAVQIICTVDKSGPKTYDAKIVKIYQNSDSVNKDMIIEVTDNELLSKTGGILQGMSGTPIIQDGMLIGAVTHVFVNNPKQGYAIFAEKMLETSECRDMQKFIQNEHEAA